MEDLPFRLGDHGRYPARLIRIMKPLATTLLAICIMLVGCNQTGTDKAQSALTVDDLAHANGIKWWILSAPSVPSGKQLCLSIVDNQGVIESRGCPRIRAGGDLKVALSDWHLPNLRYSLVSDSSDHRATIINHFEKYDGPSTSRSVGSHVKIGQVLVKKSNGNRVEGVDKTELNVNEIALVFSIEDEAQPYCRDGYKAPGKRWKDKFAD